MEVSLAYELVGSETANLVRDQVCLPDTYLTDTESPMFKSVLSPAVPMRRIRLSESRLMKIMGFKDQSDHV